MGERRRDFPLFLLPIVALPGEVVPLHVFEPRYRTMIGRCLQDGAPFGIVWESPDGLQDLGCAMEITEVLEQHPDGRMDIVTRGTRPFRLLDVRLDLPYPAAEVELLDDRDEDADPTVVAAAREVFARLVREATDRQLTADELARLDAYHMAARVDFGLEAKQGLLALRSENARLRLVTRLLRAALRRLDFVERAQARARSNGKVRFG